MADPRRVHELRTHTGPSASYPRDGNGHALYFVADEWLTRGEGAGRGAYLASKVAFIVSLAIAVALDFERLFF